MANKISALTISELIAPGGFECACGRHHEAEIRYLSIRSGAVADTVEALAAVGAKKPLVICGPNGYEAAGRRICGILSDKKIDHSLLIVPPEGAACILPDERTVGRVALSFDRSCDVILGVGSGVINDVCKVMGALVGIPTVIVGTAPSMDGYASSSSAMEVGGIKLTLPEKCPSAIVCDTGIMAQAPMRMLWAGLGDMFAKGTALCEWKLAHIATGEYYCAEIDRLVRESLDKVIRGADGVSVRSEKSIKSITEGLVLSGLCMTFAGVSRPASGLEHYFSHCWEMMSLARGQRHDLHGIQVGVGTVLTLRIFEKLRTVHPTLARAEAAADAFDGQAWEARLHRVFPQIADELIAMERRVGKNRRGGRMKRAENIISRWDEIMASAGALMPSDELLSIMRRVGMPTTPQEIGYSTDDMVDAFVCSRDVRDKYLTSSLIWDLGYMDEFADWLRGPC